MQWRYGDERWIHVRKGHAMTDRNWLAETEEFFFFGACHGWAGGNDGNLITKDEGAPGMEGWKEAAYRDSLGYAGYHFADRWGRDPDSGKPSGSKFITHWKIPAWGMWLGGDSYSKDVLPFLREVLIANYRMRKFCGGRGPAECRKGNLLYTNKYEGDFSRFSGHEYIEYIRENGERQNAGSHSYWGGSFIYLPK